MKLPRFQFRLRTLMLVVAAIAVGTRALFSGSVLWFLIMLAGAWRVSVCVHTSRDATRTAMGLRNERRRRVDRSCCHILTGNAIYRQQHNQSDVDAVAIS